MTYELEAHVWASPKCGRCEHRRYECGRYITLNFCDKTHSICIKCGQKSSCRLWLQGHAQICGGGCGITQNTQRSGCAFATLLPSFTPILGRHALYAVHPKHIILLVNVTSLNNAVTSYVTSQHCTCIGHVTIYYKRAANTWGILAYSLLVH